MKRPWSGQRGQPRTDRPQKTTASCLQSAATCQASQLEDFSDLQKTVTRQGRNQHRKKEFASKPKCRSRSRPGGRRAGLLRRDGNKLLDQQHLDHMYFLPFKHRHRTTSFIACGVFWVSDRERLPAGHPDQERAEWLRCCQLAKLYQSRHRQPVSFVRSEPRGTLEFVESIIPGRWTNNTRKPVRPRRSYWPIAVCIASFVYHQDHQRGRVGSDRVSS